MRFSATLPWRRRLNEIGAAFRPGNALQRFGDLVYPPTCIACQTATGGHHGLCAACWSAMPFIARPYCERLGTPFEIDIGAALISPAAMADPPVFARARAVAAHDGTARELVHRLKYGDRPDLAAAMAAMMAGSGRELLAEAELIVPVPLHWTRLWLRRFNQAAVLARALGQRSGHAVAVDILGRAKRTRPQVGLSRAARADNLQGAFRVAKPARPRLEGRRVLLVDDVLTTGATANAASRALLRAGAAAVDLLTFSRVIPGR